MQDQLEKAEELRIIGTQLIESQHYAVDSIQPKCVELVRMRDAFHDRITNRLETLHKCRDLQERIEQVSLTWAKIAVYVNKKVNSRN